MAISRRKLLSAVVVAAGAPLGTALAARDDLELRAFPLRRVGDRTVVWVEVTGPGAERVNSGADRARLLVGDRRYRPVKALVRREETVDTMIDLDGVRVARAPGATYMRFEFEDVPRRLPGHVRLSWVWHVREPGESVRWGNVRVAREGEPLETKSGGGFRVSIPERGWQDNGPIRLSRSSLQANADRTAWFHLVVRPGPSEGPHFPSGYVGYELRFRRSTGETVLARSARSTGTIGGGDEDREEILAQFEVGPDATGALEWTPLFSRSRGKEFQVRVPEAP